LSSRKPHGITFPDKTEREIHRLNPFAPQEDPGSYVDLRKRMLRDVLYLRVDNKIFEVVKNAFDHALILENIVLSQGEKNRLLSQILKMVLKAMLDRLDGQSSRPDPLS
jgi:hypothetical protein